MSSPQFITVQMGQVIDTINSCNMERLDNSDQKIDMIFGAYKSEDGKPYVLPFIVELERKMVNSPENNHEYLPFAGIEEFNILVPRLVLGDDSLALKDGRAFGVQAVGGSGALRMGAELLARKSNFTRVYFSQPTWDNHETVFLNGGFQECRTYRYLKPITNSIDFDGMMEDLAEAPENSVILLQMCAHNPTGCDLTHEQWCQVANIVKTVLNFIKSINLEQQTFNSTYFNAIAPNMNMVISREKNAEYLQRVIEKEKRLFPFFDAAYQGLASGDLDEDAWPVRYFVNKGFEMLIAQSFSKNLGLYSDRVGCLTVVLKEDRQKDTSNIKMHLCEITSGLYLCPGKHGANIVISVLQNPKFIKQWKECLRHMTYRLKAIRKDLQDQLYKLGTPGNWDHIMNQIGLFCYTGLTPKQVAYLATKHHMHALQTGRVNICAINTSNLPHVAEAIYDTVVNISD